MSGPSPITRLRASGRHEDDALVGTGHGTDPTDGRAIGPVARARAVPRWEDTIPTPEAPMSTTDTPTCPDECHGPGSRGRPDDVAAHERCAPTRVVGSCRAGARVVGQTGALERSRARPPRSSPAIKGFAASHGQHQLALARRTRMRARARLSSLVHGRA